MNLKLIVIFTAGCLASTILSSSNHVLAQQSHGSCSSCNHHQGSGFQEGPYYDEQYHGDQYYDDADVIYDDGPCQCDQCNGRSFRTPVRTAASRASGRVNNRVNDRFGGRFGGQGNRYGRPGETIGAPFIDGECGDCNWGPVYLSVFAGVAFIDNFQSSSTFDNGVPGELGVDETSFSTLDGLAAGGAIGRYFYRQARVEFEYTFRDNGVGDLAELTFADDLATDQNNDTLVASNFVDASGNIQSNSFMFNFVGDLRPRSVGCLNGYLGGGIGVILFDADIAAGPDSFNISDAAFAFQGIAGINFPIRDRVDLFTEYRYLGSDSISVDRTDATGTNPEEAFQFDSHSVVFGMRFLR